MTDFSPTRSVSIVVPVFNVEERIGILHESLSAVLATFGGERELIFIDDGSTDDSWYLITELSKRDASVRGVRLERNSGQTNALCVGFAYASGVVIGGLDDDLELDISALAEMMRAVGDGAKFVSGRRRGRRSPIRRLGSALYNARLRRRGSPFHDAGCGMGAVDSLLARQIATMPREVYQHRFKPVIATLTDEIVEVDVNVVCISPSTFAYSELIASWLDVETFFGTLSADTISAGASLVPLLVGLGALKATRRWQARLGATALTAVVAASTYRVFLQWQRLVRRRGSEPSTVSELVGFDDVPVGLHPEADGAARIK